MKILTLCALFFCMQAICFAKDKLDLYTNFSSVIDDKKKVVESTLNSGFKFSNDCVKAVCYEKFTSDESYCNLAIDARFCPVENVFLRVNGGNLRFKGMKNPCTLSSDGSPVIFKPVLYSYVCSKLPSINSKKYGYSSQVFMNCNFDSFNLSADYAVMDNSGMIMNVNFDKKVFGDYKLKINSTSYRMEFENKKSKILDDFYYGSNASIIFDWDFLVFQQIIGMSQKPYQIDFWNNGTISFKSDSLKAQFAYYKGVEDCLCLNGTVNKIIWSIGGKACYDFCCVPVKIGCSVKNEYRKNYDKIIYAGAVSFSGECAGGTLNASFTDSLHDSYKMSVSSVQKISTGKFHERLSFSQNIFYDRKTLYFRCKYTPHNINIDSIYINMTEKIKKCDIIELKTGAGLDFCFREKIQWHAKFNIQSVF